MRMAPIPLILMVFSFVCFVLAAWRPFPPDSPYYPRLVAAGLAFWSLTVILGYTGAFGK
jgi:hypothetical protein